MRCFAALFALMLAMPALAQIAPPQPGEVLARGLPEPSVDEDAPPRTFLLAARLAITNGRLDEGMEALERAESRALTRDERPSQAGNPSGQPLVVLIATARRALAAGDVAGALAGVEAAMRQAPESE